MQPPTLPAGRSRRGLHDRGRLRRGSGELELERGVLLEHAALELPQTCGGIDPQLVGEHTPEGLVALERLRVAARSVQREHLLPAEALAMRLTADERLELADQLCVPSQLEVHLDPLLEAREMMLLEP